ncbi:hypothetical protein ACXR2U_04585 [Jatrophihabitans sp. YIM 134969]
MMLDRPDDTLREPFRSALHDLLTEYADEPPLAHRPPRNARRPLSAGALLTAGAAAALAAWFALAPSDGGRTVGPAASTSAASSGAVPSTAPPADLVGTTPQVVVATLVSLLPPGTVSGARGGSAGGQEYGSVVFDDGRGAALVSILVAPAAQSPCGLGGGITCTARPDGSLMWSTYDFEYPQQQRGAMERSVILVRDGMMLQLQEWNAPTEKDSATTREAPPLDETQVLALLDDPAWALQVPATAAASASPYFTPTRPPGG